MTHTTQVLSERQIKDFIDDGLFLDTPNAIARAIESATLKAVSGQDDVKQRLFQLLNGAAGDGLIINEIDAAELFTDLFPEHIEFITRGAIPDATLPPAQPVPQAMETVIKALQEDADYAWSWHCNVAMAAVDEGLGHYAANQAAARFMYSLANVDTTKHPGFPPAQPAPVDEREAEIAELRAEVDAWRKQCDRLTHQVICCGVAASHPDATLTTRGAYAGKWNSAQAEEVRKLRAERDALAALQCAQAPQAGGWLPIETAPEDMPECVAVRWKDSEGNECRDLDYMEDGCWMHWHDRAEHVEIIGGHGVSYEPPYEHWMPLPAAPQPTKGQP